MSSEHEQSLQRRFDLVPEKLMQGGLIVGAERISGSLVSMTGMALERITRERMGVPPSLRLSERPVYLLDPNSKRMIMISNREPEGSPKGGLFAEVVQLDEEGRPQHYLESSDVILPNETFQHVAVGPNEFKLPPSHIGVMDMDVEGKKKFIPWNAYLSRLEDWMNRIRVEHGDDFQSFIRRFIDLKNEGSLKIDEQIRNAFPESLQSVNDKMVPVNIIIAEGEIAAYLARASKEAGFYPFAITPEELAIRLFKNIYDKELSMPLEMAYHFGFILPSLNQEIGNYSPEERKSEAQFFREQIRKQRELHGHFEVRSKYSVAIVTADKRAIVNLYEAKKEAFRRGSPDKDILKKYGIEFTHVVEKIVGNNPIFSTLTIQDLEKDSQPRDVEKQAHGKYIFPPEDEVKYRMLLNKVKADLLLTMFLRGGAPIVK